MLAIDPRLMATILHGRLDVAQSLVLTRAQHQRRLYADPAYLTVLRSLFATSTVLFLGYSLNDAYLNELRSEYESVNRRCALDLGAAEFVSRWEDLIAVLERVLGETFAGRGR